jgi:hypothetical protein
MKLMKRKFVNKTKISERETGVQNLKHEKTLACRLGSNINSLLKVL